MCCLVFWWYLTIEVYTITASPVCIPCTLNVTSLAISSASFNLINRYGVSIIQYLSVYRRKERNDFAISRFFLRSSYRALRYGRYRPLPLGLRCGFLTCSLLWLAIRWRWNRWAGGKLNALKPPVASCRAWHSYNEQYHNILITSVCFR